MAITVLTEQELRRCVRLDKEMIAAMGEAFAALARGDAEMPPILRLDVKDHNGEMDVKTAYVRGFDSFALKVSTGFFNNPKLGLPSLNGMMTLISAKTGQVEAVLLDNGYLTDIRTAAAGALAAQLLSNENSKTAGVIGCGLQARLQIQALKLVRDFSTLLVWARDETQAQDYAEEIREKLGITVEVKSSAREVVENSDIVVTTTPSTKPLVEAAWLHSGLHITAMGSDAEHKNELSPDVLQQADLFICDRISQSEKLGELHHALKAGIKPSRVIEIGQLLNGNGTGRTNAHQITVCDLTGTGVQDTAIARIAYLRAQNKGFGISPS